MASPAQRDPRVFVRGTGLDWAPAMLGPYRTLAEADSAPVHCTANPHDGTGACCHALPPHPPQFPGIIAHACGALTRPTVAGYPRAVSLVATLLLLVTSAALGAMSWSVLAMQVQQRRAGSEALLLTQAQVNEAIVKVLVTSAHPTPGTTQDHGHAKPPAPKPPAPKPPSKPPPPPAHVAPAAPPHTLLAHIGPETHAADELWRRAEHLAGSGADVTLVSTTIAHPSSGTIFTSGMRIGPEHGAAGVVGVHVLDAGQRLSAPALAGLRTGDWVEAVNGFPLDAPGNLQRAFDALDGRHTLVLEIVRDGRRIALRVDWRA
jgi:hypothetical protein